MPRKGQKQSESAKRKLRAAALARYAKQSPEDRKHTPKSIEKMRKHGKKYRASESEIKKLARRAAHAKTWANRDPKAEKIRREKISQKTSGSMLEKLGPSKLRSVIRRRRRGYKKWWAALTEDQKAEIKKKRSEGQVKRWARFTEEEALLKSKRWHETMVKNGGHRRFIPYVNCRGRTVMLDSGWEPHCYRLLERFGISFKYANDEGTAMLLDCGFYHPDFVIESMDLIIEVKGWRGKPRFFETIVPAFKRSPFSKKYSVAVCQFDISKRSYDSFEKFLGDLLFVHRIPGKYFHQLVPCRSDTAGASEELLETPKSSVSHNAAGNGNRDGEKMMEIGQSAAEPPVRQVEGSTTMASASRVQADSKHRGA